MYNPSGQGQFIGFGAHRAERSQEDRMRLMKAFAAASVLLATATIAAAPDREADLQKMLGNRVAGEPVKCITIGNITGSNIVDGTAILYNVVGGDIYVNRPVTNAAMLSRHQVLVMDTKVPQLCDVDTVQLFDRTTRIATGWVGLGEFVPYRRAR
jgi:hypothetical protein